MVLAQVVRLDMHIEYVLNSNLPNIYKKKTIENNIWNHETFFRHKDGI